MQHLHSGLSEGQKDSWKQQLYCLDNDRDEKQKETSGLSAHTKAASASLLLALLKVFPLAVALGTTHIIIHPHQTSMTGRCWEKLPFDSNCESSLIRSEIQRSLRSGGQAEGPGRKDSRLVHNRTFPLLAGLYLEVDGSKDNPSANPSA